MKGMLKAIHLLFLILLVAIGCYSQTLVERKLSSKEVTETVAVKVWLPEGYSREEKYPVIYEFVYDHGNFIASTAANLYEIPKCIIVHAEIQAGNEHYASPELNEVGQKYYHLLKKELIPYIDREFATSGFRVAIGLSQGADYTNYIFRNDPELFSGYMIFATEYPRYNLDYSEYINKLSRDRRISYFVATGDDLPERIDYASKLYEQVKKSNRISAQMLHYERAEHSQVLLYALPDAFKFLFSDYLTSREPKNESSYQYFTNLLGEIKNKYGVDPPLGLFLGNYLRVVTKTKDAENILRLADELKPRLNELDIFNLGYAAAGAGHYKEAEKLLKMSLEKMPPADPKVSPIMIYRTLALNIYDKQGNTALTFETLRQGHEKTKNVDIGLLYYLGKYAVDKKYKVQERIDALLLARNNREKSSFSSFFPLDSVDVQLAKGYLQLNKVSEARRCLQEALRYNPKNEEAINLSTRIN